MNIDIANLEEIIGYYIEDEIRDFEDWYDLKLPEDLDEAIVIVTKVNDINHILPNLLKAKKELQQFNKYK